MSVPEADKRYTYGDYLTWPENERWEIIDGVPYLQAAPTWQHQSISRELVLQFGGYLRDKPCQVFAAPFDLRLPEADENDLDVKSVTQPDLTIICERAKLKGTGCCGTPDLLIEISSPSTSKIDKLYKFNKYEKAGVKEYWIVEPEGKIVSVFILQNNGRYGRQDVYAEEDQIAVSIFPDLTIDLKPVFTGLD